MSQKSEMAGPFNRDDTLITPGYICRPFQYDCTSRWTYELVLVALRSVVVCLQCVLVMMERF